MSTDLRSLEDSAELAPVEHRARWIAWGFALQVLGVGAPAAVVLERAKHDSALGQVTRYTIRLAWHEALRSASDVGLLATGLALFVAGSMVLARPFVKRRSTLLIAVPLAATVGLLALGLAALLCAAVIAVVGLAGEGDLSGFDLADWWTPGGKRSRRDDSER